jgi:dipeptidyl aminopeptidase/acylaminoacyl peptidase
MFALKHVDDPQLSPDGKWVAYAVTSTSPKDEKSETQVWMIPVGGGEAMPMTAKGVSSSRPRFSPDGKYLAFLSARGENSRTQVWLLNRQGGEAQPLTEVRQGVGSFEWSPDSSRLVLLIQDPKPEDLEAEKMEKEGVKPAKPKADPPWIVDRLQFKQDYVGFLDRRRVHLYVFDVASKTLNQVTSGDYDDGQPAWSPDSKSIAFVSNRDPEPDSTFNSEIWVVAADSPDKGKTLRRVTNNPGEDQAPCWSPDGKSIAYVTTIDVKNFWYATNYIAVAPSQGGEPKILTKGVDRNMMLPRFSPDGRFVHFLCEDSCEVRHARIPAAGGEIAVWAGGPRVVQDYRLGKDGSRHVDLVSEPGLPTEVFIGQGPELKRLTRVNDDFLKTLALSMPEKFTTTSKDGTPVEGFFFRPVGFVAGTKYPTLLRIHGGPVGQFDFGFEFEAQLFAGNGYAVVMMNPRGSSGKGQAFCQAIFADWGNKDYEDVVAGVDWAVEQGYADPDRLGVGGWSYGGMLTNYTITKTTRFKGAISGASLGLAAANYGHDHYQRHYEVEIGLPWQNREVWDRVSPFWVVDKITTPTLWMCGEKDWNVPLINSEQMYQAMKRLGRETQLVVYPGEHHGIQRPSYRKDLYERYLAWYDKYVKGSK